MLIQWWWPLAVIIGIAGQLLSVILPNWFKRRQWFGTFFFAWYVLSFMLAFATYSVLAMRIVAGAISLYLVVLALQQFAGRLNEAYIRRSMVRNARLFIIVTVCVVLLAQNSVLLLKASLSLSAAVCAFMLFGMVLNIRRYHVGPFKRLVALKDLPTVTLAIPARNETASLEQVLSLAIKSDYPKLEILVLDDCSQDNTTAQIIKGYAQDGVRFIQGKLPADTWLGKNYACQTLAEQATGEIIIFAGVDTHFAADSIGKMVSYMKKYKLSMLSTLPSRPDSDIPQHMLLPVSLTWQLLFPITRKNIAVASACWAIQAAELKRLGGFASVKNSVFPEVHFAKRLLAEQKYRFVVANSQLGVTTRKRLHSQIETSLRTLYPRFKRSPSLTFFVTLATLVLFGLPYATLGRALLSGQWTAEALLAALVVLGVVCAHLVALFFITPRNWWLGIISLPFQLMWELLLLNFSMLLFEFGEVNWKGRNVCYPVLEAINPKEFKQIVDTLPVLTVE